MPSSLALSLILVAIPLAATSGAWQVRVGASVRHRGAVAIDSRGDVVGSTERRVGQHRVPQIVKLAAHGGRLRWQRTFRDTLDGYANRLGITANDDVIAGLVADRSAVAIARLAGTDGSVVWRHDVPAPTLEDGLAGIVLDPNGDVIAAGGFGGRMIALKLAGADGRELWRVDLGAGSADDLGIDDGGNPVVAGDDEGRTSTHAEPHTLIAMLNGATGEPRWTRDIAKLRGGQGLSVGGGAIAVAGQASEEFYGPFIVLLLDAASGDTRWESRIGRPDGGPFDPRARDTAFVSPDGDVVAAGVIDDTFVAVRLDRGTGSVVWRHDVTGDYGGVGGSITMTPSGDVLLGGSVFDRRTCWDAALVTVSAATGDRLGMRQLHGRWKDRSACASGGTDDGLSAVAVSPLGVFAIAAEMADPLVTRRLIGSYPLVP